VVVGKEIGPQTSSEKMEIVERYSFESFSKFGAYEFK
jgi:hypothetical protein